jgi:hypothetical protein
MYERYVFYNTQMADPGLDAMRDALGRLAGVVAFDARAPEAGNQRIIYIESSLDDEFSADLWRETGEGIAGEIARMAESLAITLPERCDGMLSIIYNNEDNNVGHIRERIERCLLDLTHGLLYVPETGELGR